MSKKDKLDKAISDFEDILNKVRSGSDEHKKLLKAIEAELKKMSYSDILALKQLNEANYSK